MGNYKNILKTNRHLQNDRKNIESLNWRGLFFLTVFSSLGYIFLEWLFIVTKPSYLTTLSWLEKLEIFIFVSAIAVIISLLSFLGFYLITKIFKNEKVRKIFFFFATLIPSFILATLSLLLIDNFTYTMFQFGIVSSDGILRGLYGLGLFLIFVLFTRKMSGWASSIRNSFFKNVTNKNVAGFSIILMIMAILVPLILQMNKEIVFSGYQTENTDRELPNIFLITADGLNADHMSIYGYERKTTPFLDSWENQSLVIENGFTNSAKTTGSIISILTGKYVSDTRVLYPPDVLKNEDSYQHLPGILKSLGYYTIQYGQSYYADAYAQNLLKGFDEVFQSSVEKSSYLDLLNSFLPENIAYFTYDVFNRISDRLLHIFYIKVMDNDYLKVTGTTSSFEDFQKINDMFDLIRNSSQPLFVHLHWMGTHGHLFNPREQIFSAGVDIKSQEPWNPDFYDDVILEFDKTIQGIVDFLEDNNLATNSIFIIASDHGQKWVANERLPLIFHFSQGEFASRPILNGQNIDIAPTLLDFLGTNIPDWMNGISLLTENDNQRLVYSVDVKESLTEDEKRNNNSTGAYDPPFYQFGKISMIDCDRFYELQLNGGFNLVSSTIENYETQCDYQVTSDHEAIRLMTEHLAQNKFDTTTLEEWLKSLPTP